MSQKTGTKQERKREGGQRAIKNQNEKGEKTIKHVIEPPRWGARRPGSAWAILGEARAQSTHISTIPTYNEV
jgi:hypothetical protein